MQKIKTNWHYLVPIILATILGIIAYFYIPTKGYDLFEYNIWMNNMLTLNTKDLINYILYRGEIIIMIYFYIIALIGNYQLVQVFPTILFYTIIFYIIFDFAKERKVSKEIIIFCIITFLALFKYIFVVSSFRYSLAYVIFSLGLYFEYIKDKKGILYKLLYIIPMFIHTSSFILLLFRIIMCFKNKKIRYLILAFLCILASAPNIAINILGIFSTNDFVKFIIERVNMYLIVESVPMYTQYIFRIIQTIAIFVLIIFNMVEQEDNKHNKYYSIYFIFGLFTISVMMYHTLFMRFADLLLFLLPIALINLHEKIPKLPKILQSGIYIILIIFIVCGIRIQIPIFIDMYFS